MAFNRSNVAYDLTLFEEEEEYELEKAGSQKNIVYDIKEERKKRAKAKVNPLTVLLSAAVSALVIVAVAAIVHGQAQLTELNQQISDAQGQLTELESYYTQLQMKVENKLGPSVVEEYAKNTLGMSKAESYQKEFISLSKGDKAEVAGDEKKNLLERLSDALSQIWAEE